ncbi:hypothetical protein ACFOY2_04835 [Nonomuraea purpurea]|uniref:HTH cro/C1-type domain-containing protein n=1 Tax=Nonomuraea purpurea TaxID=1849276 RepID=A0ABV8G0Z6_9ACTN
MTSDIAIHCVQNRELNRRPSMERDRTQHLANLMEQRRLALRLEWNEVAEAAGISAAFLRKIRSGTGAGPLTIAKLEAALNWAPGSIDAIRAGGEAADLSASTTEPGTQKPRTSQDIEAAIRDLAQQLSPERMRSILADLSRSERKYEDDAEQRLWEIAEIEPVIRRQLIGLLRVAREAMEDEDPEINAEVREFRPRR